LSELLEVEGVIKRFQGVPAVDGADLAVAEHSITALIGPNGAGKTSLFNVISGFTRPDAGRVLFAGKPIQGRPVHGIARLGIARTFQQPKVLRRLTLLENMLLAAQDQPGESLWRAILPVARRRDHELGERARELLRFVDLEARAADLAGVLSGGQRKLLEFARALMAEPRLVLLDEPLAGVNPILRELMLTRLEQLRKDRRVTFLVIEHDLRSVMRISDSVAVMNEGRVIFTGSAAAARGDQGVIDAYLGRAEATA
jgi:ABC-type branched-subunit amino acid transport system ATPase component